MTMKKMMTVITISLQLALMPYVHASEKVRVLESLSQLETFSDSEIQELSNNAVEESAESSDIMKVKDSEKIDRYIQKKVKMMERASLKDKKLNKLGLKKRMF